MTVSSTKTFRERAGSDPDSRYRPGIRAEHAGCAAGAAVA
jgi:hypothetical protein